MPIVTPSHRFVRLLQVVVVVALPIILLMGAVQLLFTRQYLAFEYGKDKFPADPYGLTAAQRLAYGTAAVLYVRDAQPPSALADQQLEGGPAYNVRELKHMQDVQRVYQTSAWVWQVSLIGTLLLGFTLGWRAETRPALARALKWGGLVTAGLVGLIGLLALVAWQVWFVAFHQVFFAAGTWSFAYSDTLIRLFPERFWFDAALTIAGLTTGAGLVVSSVGWWLGRPARRPAHAAVATAAVGVHKMSIKSRQERELARKRGEVRQKLVRGLVFGVIVTGVLVLAGSLLYSAFSKPKLQALAGNVVEVAADMAGFDVKLIRVKVGEPVTIRLTSLDNSHHTDGGGQHQWAVDELGLNLVAQPESSNTVSFTPDKPGTYTYYCDICCGGRANPTMQGTIVVES